MYFAKKNPYLEGKWEELREEKTCKNPLVKISHTKLRLSSKINYSYFKKNKKASMLKIHLEKFFLYISNHLDYSWIVVRYHGSSDRHSFISSAVQAQVVRRPFQTKSYHLIMDTTYPGLCAEDELIQLWINVFLGELIPKAPVLKQGTELSGSYGILWQISLLNLTNIFHEEQYLKMEFLKHCILK